MNLRMPSTTVMPEDAPYDALGLCHALSPSLADGLGALAISAPLLWIAISMAELKKASHVTVITVKSYTFLMGVAGYGISHFIKS